MKPLISLFVLVVGAAATLSAQSTLNLTANIPFAFHVGDRLMPAGEYQTARIDQSLIMVHSVEGRETAWRFMIPTTAKKMPTASSLVFRKYGDRYFLGEIWGLGRGTGAEFNKSKKEREAVTSTLNASTRQTTVVILARAR